MIVKKTGIYRITSPSGKVYIGQSRNMHRRKMSYGWNCRTAQDMIYHSIQKHGWDKHNFEVIHELPIDVEQMVLDAYEIFYIEQYRSCGFCMMNIRNGGAKGKHSAETLKKISAALIGKAVGRKHSPETRDKIKTALTGRIFSEEHKAKIGAQNKGNTYGAGCKWNVGRHHSEATLTKMRGKVKSPETRAKLSKISSAKRHSESTKQILREKLIERHKADPMRTYVRTEAHKKSLSDQRRGIPLSDTHKARLREAWAKRKEKLQSQ